jgi:tetratricopeptide (TPR) repeat protein
MTILASTYRSQGRLNDALALGQKAVEYSEKMLGREHPETLKYSAKLVLTYQKQRAFDEAAALQEAILEIMSIVLGGKHPDRLITMDNLASTYGSMGRIAEAAEIAHCQIGSRGRTTSR